MDRHVHHLGVVGQVEVGVGGVESLPVRGGVRGVHFLGDEKMRIRAEPDRPSHGEGFLRDREQRELLDPDRLREVIGDLEPIPAVEQGRGHGGEAVGGLLRSPKERVDFLLPGAPNIREGDRSDPGVLEVLRELDPSARDVVDDADRPLETGRQADRGSLEARIDPGEVDVGEVAVPPVERIRFDRKVAESLVGIGPLTRKSLGVTEVVRESNDLLGREPVVEFGRRGRHRIYTPKCVYNMSGQLLARRRHAVPRYVVRYPSSRRLRRDSRQRPFQADLYGNVLLGNRLCDWNEAEYAEYLLWVEAARARARAAVTTPPRERTRTELNLVASPPVAAES